MGPGARRLGCVLGSSVGYGTWRLITVGSMLGIHRGDLPFPTVIRLSKVSAGWTCSLFPLHVS